ncbi:MAG: acyl-CoA desaturase [Frankia sp.]
MPASSETVTPPQASVLEARPGQAAPYAENNPVRSAELPTEFRPLWAQIALWIFLVVPTLAVVGGVVFAALGGAISLIDVALAIFFVTITSHGVTIGYHRMATHGAFKAKRWLRITLAVCGSMSAEGSVIRWAADHRMHHAFSDRDGDPHSPWRYGTGFRAVARGLWWAHVGWLFDREETPKERYAPDLLKDPDLLLVDRLFPQLMALSLLAPAVLGFALTGGSWRGALTAFFWAGIVRIFVVHHTTFAINSICHVTGTRPFMTRDKAVNVWPLAILSMGESWHNYHHADPTSARHGVDPGQLDSSAAFIRIFERVGWVSDVRWPKPARIAARRAQADTAP